MIEEGAGAADTHVTVLFLVADTGGGHRAAAQAVGEALQQRYPGVFTSVLCDPLGGPESARLLRWLTRLYGPSIRLAPWVWGALFHSTDSRPAVRLLRSTLLRFAISPVNAAVSRHRPVAIVSFHPLTGHAAVRARDAQDRRVPLLTVVTDLVRPHAAWWDGRVDRIVVSPTVGDRLRERNPDVVGRHFEIGVPVSSAYRNGPLRPADRAALRRSLGLPDDRFVVLITGGGEGSGGIARRAAALVRRVDGVTVVAVCGRNRGLRRRLDALAARSTDRLIVKGFVDNMADWMRCADVVVGKAGPGTIAEATCAGTPLLLTSHVPGQERGNARYVAAAGAGRYVPTVRQLVREVRGLRCDPSTAAAMRSAARRLGRPQAAGEIAALLVDLVRAALGDGDAATAGESSTRCVRDLVHVAGGRGAHAG